MPGLVERCARILATDVSGSNAWSPEEISESGPGVALAQLATLKQSELAIEACFVATATVALAYAPKQS